MSKSLGDLQHRYDARGPQAIHPQAFLGLFEPINEAENTEHDYATIVTIRGPISQHGAWWESYESIRARVDEACAKAAPAVILRIDSPGGEVHGLFDTARAIRGACDRADKELLVHVEGQCSSAAYALACVADRIMASSSADVGSIGIIAARIDVTAADAQAGVNVELIKSGAKKAHGNPHEPLTSDEIVEHQAKVDLLATEFFELVSVHRGIATEKIAALEAASFRGSAAVKAGLVDELGSFDHLLASLGAVTGETTTMDEKEKEARAALRSLAEDEDRDEKERARYRKALAALDDEEEEAQDEENDDEEARAQDEDDDEDAQAAASPGTVSAATAGAVAAHGSEFERRLADLEKAREAEQRDEAIAAHGGVTPELAKVLAKKPLNDVKELLEHMPKPRKPKLGDAAATTVVTGERGDDRGRASRLPPNEALALDRAMGLSKPKLGVRRRKGVLEFGAVIDEGGE